MTSMQSMTVEDFVARAIELRKNADDAETAFLTFLCEAEDAGVHQGAGLSFTELLTRNNICRPERYAKFKRVFTTLGDDVIKDVGTHAVVAAGDFSTPEAQNNVIESAKRWEKANDRPISEESAKRISKEQKVRQNAQNDVIKHGRARSYDELLAMEERLRKENTELHETIKLLKEELRQTKKELAAVSKAAKAA